MIDGARELALRLGSNASKLINERFEEAIEVHQKADTSVVTQTDVDINQLVLDAVTETFPDHGFIGEEFGSHNIDSEFVWICDPIDGTRPFTLGFPISTFALALLHDGRPVLSVVAYPIRNWIYEAEVGKGAFLNGRPIRVSELATIAGGVVDVMCPNRFRHYVPNLYDVVGESGGKSVSYGSVALTATAVARGAMVGSLFSGTHPWDAAASKLIVEEAGGRFTDLRGNDQRYDSQIFGYVASNGKTHDQLLEIVRSCGIVTHEP